MRSWRLCPSCATRSASSPSARAPPPACCWSARPVRFGTACLAVVLSVWHFLVVVMLSPRQACPFCRPIIPPVAAGCLCAPAGTGKTLLAKAVAGEAGVPFFSIGTRHLCRPVPLCCVQLAGCSCMRGCVVRCPAPAPACLPWVRVCLYAASVAVARLLHAHLLPPGSCPISDASTSCFLLLLRSRHRVHGDVHSLSVHPHSSNWLLISHSSHLLRSRHRVHGDVHGRGRQPRARHVPAGPQERELRFLPCCTRSETVRGVWSACATCSSRPARTWAELRPSSRSICCRGDADCSGTSSSLHGSHACQCATAAAQWSCLAAHNQPPAGPLHPLHRRV